jgi:ABC-2 type transport system permease protein
MRAEATAERQRFGSVSRAISRFVVRRSIRGTVLWAAIFGVFVASKAAGYATAYPTVTGRAQLAASFGNNDGLKALFGTPHSLETVAGFTAWNTLGVMAIIGSIWALLLATRTFRGEEAAGRWELVLAGPTTARRATINTLVGLGACIVIFYIIAAAAFTAAGQLHGVNFTASATLFFALAAIAGLTVFMAVGALMSQLMPIRSRAAGAAAVIFGVCFLLRAMGDITSATWLLDVTPFGWIEKLQPLYHPQPLWLIPLATLILIVVGLSVWLAGRRDLGASVFADKDSAPAHVGLLNHPLAAAFRLNRTSIVSWLLGITFIAAFFGGLTKAAVQVFSSSQQLGRFVNKLAHAAQQAEVNAFLGIIFLLLIVLVMAYAASTVSALREDEAEGYLDNLLVRPVSRLQWLGGRMALSTMAIIVASALMTLAVWFGVASGHLGVSSHVLWQAGLNALAPILLTLGIAVCAFGIVPRLTSVIGYGVLAWSFLIQIVSSGLHLNHWLLDTSVLYHVSLTPAAPPVWHTDVMMVGLGLVLAVIGALAFNYRDLQAE